MQSDFFKQNRKKLADIEVSPIVLTAHARMQRRADASFAFVQESSFWWLTGIEEPGWRLLLVDGRAVLCAPAVDETHRIFDGSLSDAQALKVSGADEVLSVDVFRERLKEVAQRHKEVLTIGEDPAREHYDFMENPSLQQLRGELAELFQEVGDCRRMIARQRAIKDEGEVAATERAIAVTVEAFVAVKKQLSSLRLEHEVEAEFSYAFHKKGYSHAYDPIVAGGEHACTLHYAKNDSALPNRGLLLMDIGASVDGYCADITRTYAIGTPSEREIAVHGAVEKAHKEIIALLRPGLSVMAYHDQVDVIMKRALASIGLFDSEADYRRYFPHAISHGLGVDVHDSLGGASEFAPGMIVTVEPGIYIPEEGIGVRIEDDILITDTGHRNLSGSLPTGL